MMRLLRIVWRFAIMNVVMSLEYRGAMFIYMVNTVAAPVISLLVLLTVREHGARMPIDRGQIVTYYVGLGLVAMLTGTWLSDWLAEQIRLGGLSPSLMRPAPYITHDIGNNIGEKLVKLPLLLPLIAIIALFFRHDLRLPALPLSWLLFALALPLAATVAFLLDFLVGSLAFWVQDVRGLIRVKMLVGAFLAGQVIPLALFPPAVAPLLQAQPFRYTLSFPLEILTGHLSAHDLLAGFAWQIGYCVALWAAYRLIWRWGLRSYAAVGA